MWPFKKKIKKARSGYDPVVIGGVFDSAFDGGLIENDPV